MKSLAAFAICTGVLGAQSLDEARASLRDAARSVRYSSFLAAVMGLAEESVLSGARFAVDDDPDTAFDVLTVPLLKEFPLGDAAADDDADDDGPTSLRVEAVFGYVSARTDFGDLWGGGLPGLETRVVSEYQAYGGVVGVGVDLPLWGMCVSPMLEGGISTIDNTGSYSGPGAAVSALLLDGILFNLDATYAIYGGALQVQPARFVWGQVLATPMLRYDYRRLEALQVDDPSQDDAGDQQWAAVRFDLEGPTGFAIAGRDVIWTGSAGYKRFFGDAGELIGFDDYHEFGGGLLWDCAGELPVLSRIGLSGTVLVGDDVFGWTIGGAFRF